MTDPFRKPFRAVDQPWHVTLLDVAILVILLADMGIQAWRERA